jgi:hypothetical protein
MSDNPVAGSSEDQANIDLEKLKCNIETYISH